MTPISVAIRILLAAGVGIVLGMIWYGPLFGKRWMQLTRRSKKSMQSPGASTYMFAVLASLLKAGGVWLLTLLMGIFGMLEAALLGAFIWLAFVATSQLNAVLWDEQPAALYILNNGYLLVELVLMSLILAM